MPATKDRIDYRGMLVAVARLRGLAVSAMTCDSCGKEAGYGGLVGRCWWCQRRFCYRCAGRLSRQDLCPTCDTTGDQQTDKRLPLVLDVGDRWLSAR